MGLVLNVSVPLFNLMKYIIVSLGLGILSEAVGDALERFRRSVSLLKDGKVLIGGRKNRIFRTVSFGASPTVLCCSILLTLTILIAEGSLEFGSDTVSIGIPITGFVKTKALGDVRLYSSAELQQSILGAVLGKSDTCAARMGDKISIWNTRLFTLETGDNMTERVSCPRNLTTSHLLRNLESSYCLELSKLRNETAALAFAYGGEVKKRFSSYFIFAKVSLNISGTILRTWKNLTMTNRVQILGLVQPESRLQSPNKSQIDCLITRTFLKGNITNYLHGCAGLSKNRSNYVFYQERSTKKREIPAELLWEGLFLAATITGVMNEARREQVMSVALRQRKLRPPIRDVLVISVLGRMAEEGELSQRPSRTEERVIGFSEQLRPEVQGWAVAVFFAMIGGLSLMSLLGNWSARRIYPIGKMVGEKNLLRKWALEKEAGKHGDVQEGKIWLVSESVNDASRITVCRGEPEHRTMESSVQFTNASSSTFTRN